MSDSNGGIFHGSPFLFGSPTYWVTSLSRDPARFLVFLEGGDLVVTSGHRPSTLSIVLYSKFIMYVIKNDLDATQVLNVRARSRTTVLNTYKMLDASYKHTT